VSEFTVTAHGMRAILPVIEVTLSAYDLTFYIALLGCRNANTHAGLGLLLRRCPHVHGEHDVYECGLAFDATKTARLVSFSSGSEGARSFYTSVGDLEDTPIELFPTQPKNDSVLAGMKWSIIHILHRPQPDTLHSFGLPFLGEQWHAGFMFSKWSISELNRRGFVITHQDPLYLMTRVTVRGDHVRDHEYVTVRFMHSASGESFAVTFGRCTCLQPSKGVAWAMACVTISPSILGTLPPDPHALASVGSEIPRACQQYHICEWSNWSRTFGDVERSVRLTFSMQTYRQTRERPIIHALGGHWLYLVAEVELSGDVYTRCAPVEHKGEHAGGGFDAPRRVTVPKRRDIGSSLHLELGPYRDQLSSQYLAEEREVFGTEYARMSDD
jgi:hypothetical protein